MQLFEMKQSQKAALDKADALLAAAENAGRALTDAENIDVDNAVAEAKDLGGRIANVERQNTIRSMVSPKGTFLVDQHPAGCTLKAPKQKLSQDYFSQFHAWLSSGGTAIGAAMYEGAGSAGGFAVPVVVDDQIVPLAPQETAIRLLATVLPTSSDIRIPVKTSFGASALKLESGATENSFTESNQGLGQFTLSAFMAGTYTRVSWELAQDVPAFQAFAIGDMLQDQRTLEETLFVSGTGIGQAQGMLGNVGAGTTEEPDANGNLVSIDGTLDLVGSLNALYHGNASFLMARPTSIIIRKAQRQANLFEPVWTRSGSQDYLHGYPVQYAAAMPAAARGATPLLFGDFAAGYVIGDRGGSGINVKVLDQPFALQGQIALLAYRRTDGRVRRSEAIQSYNIAAS